MRASWALLILCACGGDKTGHLPDGPPTPQDGSVDAPAFVDMRIDTMIDGRPDASIDAPPIDAPPDAPDAPPPCIANAPCNTNPGACFQGRTACNGGIESCVDGPPVADGMTCNGTDSCTAGTCLPPSTVMGGDLDLSTMSATPGRTCAESPRMAVAAFAIDGVQLTADPGSDCLAAGDEVILIDLQGSATSVANVGKWERLTVQLAAGTGIQFTDNIGNTYGDPTDQKIALVRVPRFGALTVSAGTHLVASSWDGSTGGILALRAGSIQVDGAIDGIGTGYRPGRWSSDGGCNSNVATESGESIAPAVFGTAHIFGASGGVGVGSGLFNNNTPMTSSPGHATAGTMGNNYNARPAGEPGTTYGAPDASRLTMGSAPGGNLTCSGGSSAPVVSNATGGSGGGIVALFGGSITVGASGAIRANGVVASRDGSGAGGYIFVDVSGTAALGTNVVSARGAKAIAGCPATVGVETTAGDGYIAVRATTITGTTTPAHTVVP